MTKIEESIDVPAPLAEVFAYASDWRLWEKWWEGVSDFQPITEVTRGNGTRYAYKAWVSGITANLEVEIYEFAENIGWRAFSTKGVPHKTQWVFEGRGERTRLTYILEYKLPVPLLGPLLDVLFMRPGWQRRLRHSLQNLKIHFEQAGRPS